MKKEERVEVHIRNVRKSSYERFKSKIKSTYGTYHGWLGNILSDAMDLWLDSVEEGEWELGARVVRSHGKYVDVELLVTKEQKKNFDRAEMLLKTHPELKKRFKSLGELISYLISRFNETRELDMDEQRK